MLQLCPIPRPCQAPRLELVTDNYRFFGARLCLCLRQGRGIISYSAEAVKKQDRRDRTGPKARQSAQPSTQ